MHLSGQSNDSIHNVDLQALSKTRSDPGPVFSLYLGATEAPLERFNTLLKEVEQQKNMDLASQKDQEQWGKEADHIRQWLKANQPIEGNGVSVFSSLQAGLWQVFRLPVPVCDRLVAGDRPYLRPLEIMQAEGKGGKDQQVEAQRVEEVITKGRKGQGAVLGPEQTFLAVRAKTVRLLVVEENFCLPGGVCPNCGFMGTDERRVCMLCGMALRPEPDIVEVALKRVLEAGGEIEILRSTQSRRALEQHGRIGALVRTESVPPERDTANRQPFEKGGKIDQDVLHDETVEESFPASDPPGGHTSN